MFAVGLALLMVAAFGFSLWLGAKVESWQRLPFKTFEAMCGHIDESARVTAQVVVASISPIAMILSFTNALLAGCLFVLCARL